jgi:lipid-A-disaccharide synthase-like uncharacterized protein
MDLFQPLFVLRIATLELPFSLLTFFALSGNALFTARALVQWIASERASKVVVPVAFWWISILATFIHLAYSLARRDGDGLYDPDLPMFFGLAVTLVPYIRSLRIHYRPDRPARAGRPIVAVAASILAVLVAVGVSGVPFDGIWLFTLGLVGNVVFRARFILAWVQTESRRQTVLTRPFWILGLVGSLILIVYSLLRSDPVFLLSYIFNAIPCIRNLTLIRRQSPPSTNETSPE